ncbi:MAG: alpha/beta fold hydrolase [Hyphomicrobiaceae bacterium]
MRELEIDVKGQKLKLKEDGEGQPLLFLHGAGGSSWNPMLKLLAQRFRVMAPEHPGFGRSQIPDWMMSVGDLAFFYLDALETMDLKGVHLAGHSLGGWTAAEIAVRNTSRLKSLTLMSPAGCRSDDVPFGDIFLWDAETATRAQFYNQKLAEDRIKLLPNADLDVVLQNKAAVARLAWSPRLHNPQLKYWLHRIDVPALLIWGRDDRIVPFDCHKAFVREIKGIRLLALPESGHSLHTERAAECDAAIAAFGKEIGA